MCLESFLNIPSHPTTKWKGQHTNTHSLACRLITFIPVDHTNWVLLTPAISHLIEGKTSSGRRCIYLWPTLSFKVSILLSVSPMYERNVEIYYFYFQTFCGNDHRDRFHVSSVEKEAIGIIC